MNGSKFFGSMISGVLVLMMLVGCAAPVAEVVATTEVVEPTDPPKPTATPEPTATATSTPTPEPTATFTPTLTPTETLTPTPSPTPMGGGSGSMRLVADLYVIDVPLDDPEEFEVLVSRDRFESQFGITEVSGLRSSSVSPRDDIAAIWICSSSPCDSQRGPIYLFTNDFKQKATVDAAGFPSFNGWSADQDRLLYYLGSTIADDFYLVKTKGPDFGEVIKIGQMRDVSWAPDRQSIYAQTGSKVTQFDLDGNELETWTCMFNDDCIHAPSPDGKRFAGIQKHVPGGGGNPTITITNQDFSEKKTFFISDDTTLIISVEWLPDNRHLVVYGQTAVQRRRRFWRLDYLSIIDTETGEERVIDLEIPEESETFYPCGLTPDGQHMVYLGVVGRVKHEGRIYFSGRASMIYPLMEADGSLERLTIFDDSWEHCPTWQLE